MLQCHGLREQSSHRLLHSFTPLEVQRKIFLMFLPQFGGGSQTFPSLCDPRGMLRLVLNAHRSPTRRWGLLGMAGGSVQKSKTPPKLEASCALAPPTTFFLPLISLCHRWIHSVGIPTCGRTACLKSLVFTVGRENHQRLGLAAPQLCCCAGGWQPQGAARAGRPQMCPFELGSRESTTALSPASSLFFFFIFYLF